ncbi:hypothetical protein [Streptomyces sp. NPDC050485]
MSDATAGSSLSSKDEGREETGEARGGMRPPPDGGPVRSPTRLVHA